MNELQIFSNSEFGDIRIVEIKGKPYAVGNDIANALEYAKPYKAISDHCKGALTWGVPTNGGNQEMKVIPEGDIYRLIVKAADQSRNPKIKEKAERFESWIFDEVLPALRKTGTYSINPVTNIKQQEAEARLRNARSREANMYYKLAEKYPNNPLYQQVLHSKATEALAGRALIPLPEVEERLYSATEVGKKIGLSKNMIGKLSEKYSLKTEQWGKWCAGKSDYGPKEVETFRYKVAAIEKFRECWEIEQQERKQQKKLEVVKGGAAQ